MIEIGPTEIPIHERPYDKDKDKGLELLAETGSVFGVSEKDVKRKMAALALSRGAAAVYGFDIQQKGPDSYAGNGIAYKIK